MYKQNIRFNILQKQYNELGIFDIRSAAARATALILVPVLYPTVKG